MNKGTSIGGALFFFHQHIKDESAGACRSAAHFYTSLRQNPRMRFCRMRQPVRQHRCCRLKVLHQQDFQTYTSLRQNPRMRFCRMGFLPDRDIGAGGTNVSFKVTHRWCHFKTSPPRTVFPGSKWKPRIKADAGMRFFPSA